jgi:CheY-like chemotaxis protein
VGRGGAGGHDLILMDLAMPVMTGEEATRELRGLGVSCPIIAVSAHVCAADRTGLLSHGFTDLIEKPIAVSRVAAVLQSV